MLCGTTIGCTGRFAPVSLVRYMPLRRHITLICFALLFSIGSQAGDWLGPKHLDVDAYFTRQHSRHQNGFGTDDLYLIGWSKKGAIAILYLYPNGEEGYVATFSIKDLVTDEVLWSAYFDYDALRPLNEECVDKQHKGLDQCIWEQNREEFDAQLSKFGIEKSEVGSVESFPLKEKGDQYSVEIKSGAVIFKSKRLGEKKLSVVGENSDIVGYVRSPFRNRLAVVLVERKPAFEGAVHASLSVVGASLTQGFGSK